MPYSFLEHTADVAFKATSPDLPGLFRASADATLNTMVSSLLSVRPAVRKEIRLLHSQVDLLLFDFLQELVYFKDAEALLLRVEDIQIEKASSGYSLVATALGEEIDPLRHDQGVDVKAVTLHQFELERTDEGWQCHVILDV